MEKMKYVWAMIMICFSLITHAQVTHATSNTFSSLQGLSPDRGGVKAAREFWKRYREGKDEKWYRLSKGYLAEFMDGDIATKVVYDKRGNWCYTLRQYSEKELPKEVRALVKSTYYDFSIGWVKEVTQFQSLVYVVHIDNGPEWKDLTVRDGEIEVSHEVTP